MNVYVASSTVFVFACVWCEGRPAYGCSHTLRLARNRHCYVFASVAPQEVARTFKGKTKLGIAKAHTYTDTQECGGGHVQRLATVGA